MRTVEFEEEICCVCGLHFGVESSFQKIRETDHELFYCPNGHGQSYTMTEEEIAAETMEEDLRQARAKNRELLCKISNLEAKAKSGPIGRLISKCKKLFDEK